MFTKLRVEFPENTVGYFCRYAALRAQMASDLSLDVTVLSTNFVGQVLA